MFKIVSEVFIVAISCALVQAGFLGSQLAYNVRYHSPVSFATEHFSPAYGDPPYATPLPVAPLDDPHTYAVGYSASPPVVKFHSFNPLTSCTSVRSHHKFDFPAPVPSFYNAPPAGTYNAPPIAYSGYPSSRTVIKFGHPITTTTYSTATAAVASVPLGNPLNNVATGW